MSSPAFNEKTFDGLESAPTSDAMTLSGTFNKVILLTILLFISGTVSFMFPNLSLPAYIGCMIVSLILGFAICFKPDIAPWAAPLYTIGEGVLLGIISSAFEEEYDGIVGQAIFATFAVTFIMLGIYRSGLIKVNNKLRSIIIVATFAVFLLYLADILIYLFAGHGLGFVHFGMISIIISLVICGIAAFNLLLDFDLISRGVAARAPKFMEWYCAYGVMVTIIWLYLEILKLLGRRK